MQIHEGEGDETEAARPAKTVQQSAPAHKAHVKEVAPSKSAAGGGAVGAGGTAALAAALAKREQRKNQEIVACRHPDCVKQLRKEMMGAHMRKIQATVDPQHPALSGTDAHIDVRQWMFLVAPDDETSYCGKNHGAVFGSELRGCRRPYGDGPGFCNKVSQLTCQAVVGCVCGSTLEIAKSGGAQKCVCPAAAFGSAPSPSRNGNGKRVPPQGEVQNPGAKRTKDSAQPPPDAGSSGASNSNS